MNKKPKVIIGAVVAACALMQPTASAETEAPMAPSTGLTVSAEATAEECGAVVRTGHDIAGGCVFHATNDALDMVSHSVFGEILEVRCATEFTAHMGGDGEGWIPLSNVAVGHVSDGTGSSNCGHFEGGFDSCHEAAAVAEGHPGDWHIQLYEDTTDGSLWMQLELCFEDTIAGTITGDMWMSVTQDPTTGHVEGFSSQDHRLTEAHGLAGMEYSGSWIVKAADELVVSH